MAWFKETTDGDNKNGKMSVYDNNDDICSFLSRDYSSIFKKCGKMSAKGDDVGQLYQRSFSNEEQHGRKCSTFDSQTNVSQRNILYGRSLSADADFHVEINVKNVRDIKDCLNSSNYESNESEITRTESDPTENNNGVQDLDNSVSSDILKKLRNTKTNLLKKSRSLGQFFDRRPTLCESVSEAGKMKISLQYFPSIRQLRISLFHAKELGVDACCLVTEAAILGNKGQMKKKCSSKKRPANSHSAVFNECLYLNVKKENMENSQLRVRLYEVQSGFKKNIEIGGVLISLDELNFDLDTVLHLPLTSPERHRQIINGEDVQVFREKTIEEEMAAIMKICDDRCMRFRAVRSFSWMSGLA